MDAIFEEYQEQDEKKAKIGSVIWMLLLFLIIIFPWMSHQTPPPGQEGIFVNLGIPDVGEGDENGTAAAPDPAEEDTSTDTPTEDPEPAPEPEPPKEEAPKPEPTNDKKVLEDNSEEIALKKEKERQKAEEARKKAEAERKRRAEAEAKRKAEEEAARKKAAAEAKRQAEEARKKAEADKLKNELGGLFGNGSGNGDNGTAGNQGNPDGDPDASVLEGVSKSAGKVGTGLANRGGKGPSITDNSQATGRVVIWVCIDEKGNVISADYTQGRQGETSTTANPLLVKLAEENARGWNFDTGGLDKQCGTITYEFKVQ